MHIILALIFVAILLNLAAQRKSKNMVDVFKTSIVVSFVIIIFFQVAAYFVVGYLDPFVIIAVVVQLFLVLPVGLLVGFLWLKYKSSNTTEGES